MEKLKTGDMFLISSRTFKTKTIERAEGKNRHGKKVEFDKEVERTHESPLLKLDKGYLDIMQEEVIDEEPKEYKLLKTRQVLDHPAFQGYTVSQMKDFVDSKLKEFNKKK